MITASIEPHGGESATPPSVMLHSGIQMPIVGLGGGIFDGPAEEAVLSSFRLGYRLVDTAANYKTEAAIGRAVRRSELPRDSFFLVSKAPTSGYHAVLASFERSLAELQVNFLDGFLLHGAAANGVRDLRAAEHASARIESWRALAELRCRGPPPYRRCARAIGVCNHSPRQLLPLLEIATPDIHQIELTPLLQRNETLEFCASHGIVCQGYGNGGGGWKLWRKRPTLDFLHAPAVLSAAAAHGVSPMQVSLRWSLQRGVAVVPKAIDVTHQQENLRLFHFELSAAEMAALNSLDGGKEAAASREVATVRGDPRSVYGFLDPEEIL